jgi:hypothetical protein
MQDLNFYIDEEYNYKKKKSFFKRVKEKMFKMVVFFIVWILFQTIKKSYQNIQERKRYRRIIKKGLFWDTEYLIEKDND